MFSRRPSEDAMPLFTYSGSASFSHSSDHAGEEPKIAVEDEGGIGLLKYLFHLIPVFITAAILSLCMKTVYFCDLDYPQLNSILNAFQFVAKAHEISISASLSAIVLHRIRFELSANGLPLGFITSGYQLSSLSYLFSKQYWGAATGPFGRNKSYRLPLGLLIFATFFLTAVVGPSSAIVIIPKLNWWQYDDPFSGTSGHTFTNASYTDLWPNTITTSLIANVTYCISQGELVDQQCPAGGSRELIAWPGSFQNQGASPNISMPNEGQVSRYLSAAYHNHSEGWSIASTVSVRPARNLGSLWQYVNEFHLKLARLKRPMVTASVAKDLPMKKPLVQVQCGLISNADKSITVEYPNDEIYTNPPGLYGQEVWSLNSSIDPSVLDSQILAFEWVDLSDLAGRPMLGALFAFSDAITPKALLPCTIDASWVPVKMWLDPNVDDTVLQDSPNPLDVINDQTLFSRAERLSIDKAWAEVLNPFSGVRRYNQNLTTIEAAVAGFGYIHGDGNFHIDPPASIPWLFSIILSMQLADGLARVHANENTIIYHKDDLNVSDSFARSLNDINVANYSWYPPTEHFDDVAGRSNASEWTQILWQVDRLGYGWGFNSVTVKISAAVLLAHALMVIVHIPLAMLRRWTSNSWESMGELLALAINSSPTERLRNTSAGVSKKATWRELVRVREVEKVKLELVFDGGKEGQKPSSKTKYH